MSNVVNMASMFTRATSFNGDLSCWNVGQVRRMNAMFAYATSFDRQLGGAWATSTAEKHCMFNKSPGGTIARGKDEKRHGYHRVRKRYQRR